MISWIMLARAAAPNSADRGSRGTAFFQRTANFSQPARECADGSNQRERSQSALSGAPPRRLRYAIWIAGYPPPVKSALLLLDIKVEDLPRELHEANCYWCHGDPERREESHQLYAQVENGIEQGNKGTT
jgi:hypothetical protein